MLPAFGTASGRAFDLSMEEISGILQGCSKISGKTAGQAGDIVEEVC